MIGAYQAAFPSCCGATIIHAFSEVYTDERYLFKNRKFINGHVYIAILAADQQERFGPTLKKAGFRCVSETVVNASSSNRLYIWIRDDEPVKRKVTAVKKSIFRKL